MDTRSSSGSGSGSNSANLEPTLNQDRPRASQHATYTTAGTVYNPQTAPPLQPPARRGRASRWPPAIPADLSAFNDSVLGALPRARYRSPPTTAATLRHYSPLQQNQHRAVDPRVSADHHRPAKSLSDPKRSASGDSSDMSLSLANALPCELLADELTKSIICGDCGERFQTVAMADFHVTRSGHDNFSKASDDNSHALETAFLQQEEIKEEEDLTQFNNYSVKTLTNLASYPNPNQRMAQRCLDRARETFRAAAENPRSVSPNSSRPAHNGGVASSSSHFSAVGRESLEYYSRIPRNAHMNSSTRSSVLSNGPGAPQPLTAGPPGQRHYKASTLEGPLRVLQESAQKPNSLAMAESVFGTNPPNTSVLSQFDGPPFTKIPEALRAAEREIKPLSIPKEAGSPHTAEQTVFGAARGAFGAVYRGSRYHAPTVLPNQKDNWKNGTRETKTQDELGGYYRDSRGGIPYDYDPATFVSVPKDNSDLRPPLGRILPSSSEAQRQRDADLARHRERFYAGAPHVFRPWDFRYNEIRDKARDWERGHVDECGPLTLAQIEAAVDPAQLGKPRNISISLINHLQPHDAARPLLPMLYSTLANLKNNTPNCQEPQGTKQDDRLACPRPGYIGQEREERMRAQTNRACSPTPSRENSRQW